MNMYATLEPTSPPRLCVAAFRKTWTASLAPYPASFPQRAWTRKTTPPRWSKPANRQAFIAECDQGICPALDPAHGHAAKYRAELGITRAPGQGAQV